MPCPIIRSDSNDDANKLLIRTRYAGIQYPDYLQAVGKYQLRPELPYILGMDVAGIVIDKGNDVSGDIIRLGDESYAQHAVDWPIWSLSRPGRYSRSRMDFTEAVWRISVGITAPRTTASRS